MRSQQIVLSEVAYLLRSCEYLIGALQDVETAAGRLDDLDPLQDSMLETATVAAVGGIKGELDLAARLAEHWQAAVEGTRR